MLVRFAAMLSGSSTRHYLNFAQRRQNLPSPQLIQVPIAPSIDPSGIGHFPEEADKFWANFLAVP
jgi:hypothetical protein